VVDHPELAPVSGIDADETQLFIVVQGIGMLPISDYSREIFFRDLESSKLASV